VLSSMDICLVVSLISFDDVELILLVNSWTLDLDDFH
jgi:hypothetical protein